MHKFDQEIQAVLTNAKLMMKARSTIMGTKMDAGADLGVEIKRMRAFEKRVDRVIADWQYWLYDHNR